MCVALPKILTLIYADKKATIKQDSIYSSITILYL